MSWDRIYKLLQWQLGRQPTSGEVQQKMLEVLQDQQHFGDFLTEPMLIPDTTRLPCSRPQ
jgi:hypothetical protein